MVPGFYTCPGPPEVRPAASPVRIMRVPTSGGPPQLVLEGRGIDSWPVRGLRRLCVSSARGSGPGQLIFSAFDPRKGRGAGAHQGQPQATGQTLLWLGPVAHGSRLAFTQYDAREGHIQILPLGRWGVSEVNVKGGMACGTCPGQQTARACWSAPPIRSSSAGGRGAPPVLWRTEARPDNSGLVYMGRSLSRMPLSGAGESYAGEEQRVVAGGLLRAVTSGE